MDVGEDKRAREAREIKSRAKEVGLCPHVKEATADSGEEETWSTGPPASA
jgi:hypothetical protein